MSYIIPQKHKCIKCGHEFLFSEPDGHSTPVIDGQPTCPKCFENFIKQHVGLGYCTINWDGQSAYNKAMESIRSTEYHSPEPLANHVVETKIKYPRNYTAFYSLNGNDWVHLLMGSHFLGETEYEDKYELSFSEPVYLKCVIQNV